MAIVLAIALALTSMAVVTPGAAAQDDETQRSYVANQVATEVESVINGTVVGVFHVEFDGTPYTVHEVSVGAVLAGSVPDLVLVYIPGGVRSDGATVLLSNSPAFLEIGENVRLALEPAASEFAVPIGAVAPIPAPVFAISGGEAGVTGLSPAGTLQQRAAGDFALNGFNRPGFVPPVEYKINPANSGLGPAATIAAVRAGFDRWENDASSDIDFTYTGETSASGLNFGNGHTDVSWQFPNAQNALGGSLAIAHLEIRGNNYEFEVVLSRDYQWTHGAVSGHYDITTAMAHEVGHGLGLGHVGVQSELMFATIRDGVVKPLGAGDLSGAAFLYPPTTPPIGTAFGFVRAGSEPLAGVTVSTAEDEVQTGADGRFDIVVDPAVPETTLFSPSARGGLSIDAVVTPDYTVEPVDIALPEIVQLEVQINGSLFDISGCADADAALGNCVSEASIALQNHFDDPTIDGRWRAYDVTVDKRVVFPVFNEVGATVFINDSGESPVGFQFEWDGSNPLIIDVDAVPRWYQDNDGDGFGDADGFPVLSFPGPSDVTNNDDCNDDNRLINPEATELPGNGIDEDCDGEDGDAPEPALAIAIGQIRAGSEPLAGVRVFGPAAEASVTDANGGFEYEYEYDPDNPTNLVAYSDGDDRTPLFSILDSVEFRPTSTFIDVQLPPLEQLKIHVVGDRSQLFCDPALEIWQLCRELSARATGGLVGFSFGLWNNLAESTQNGMITQPIFADPANTQVVVSGQTYDWDGSNPFVVDLAGDTPYLDWYQDTDGDGFGDPESEIVSFPVPPGPDSVTNSDDCDDQAALTNPAGSDLTVNGIDENCDGTDGPPPVYCMGQLVTINMRTGASGIGTNGDDVILGTLGDDMIRARGGDDIICASRGNDDVHACAGDDEVNGGGGNDTVRGGSGDDVIRGSSGDDSIWGQGGRDVIFGGPGDDDLSGGGEADTINGNSNDDTISGGSGNDMLLGDSGNDLIRGGRGTDTIRGGDGQDSLRGGRDSDIVDGELGNDDVFGGLGGDRLAGGPGNDLIVGGSGSDTCDDTQGANTFRQCESGSVPGGLIA